MDNNESLYFDLFAHRINYMDYSDNENFIINKLKLKLIELGHVENQLNNILFGFYNYFDIPITMSEIENVEISTQPLTLNFLFTNQINEENEDEDDDMPPLVDTSNNIEHQFNIINLLNTILGGNLIQLSPYNQQLVQPLNNLMEDVVVTTDENTLNTLNILKITKDMNEKCTVCLLEMNEDEEYFDIKCKHIFHKDCLETYLKNYNHICPVCREEIGTSHPNIN